MTPTDEEFERKLPLAAICEEFHSSGRHHSEFWHGASRPDDWRDEESAFHPSETISGRKAVLDRARVPQLPRSGTSARVMAMGSAAESILVSAMRWKGIVVGDQVPVWCDWALRPGQGHFETWTGRRPGQGPRKVFSNCLFRGTLDTLVRYNGRLFLVDEKSAHGDKFDRVLKEGPGDDYCLQLALYDWMYEGQYGETPDELRLLYMSREDGRLHQCYVDRGEWRPRAIALAYRRRDEWEGWLTNHVPPAELPLTDYGKPHWKCNPIYCGYAVQVRADNGKPVCPQAHAHWSDLVASENNGKQHGWKLGAAIRLAARFFKIAQGRT